jgi:DNA helicase-2/ATP-dependent DNA helicase PcrA
VSYADFKQTLTRLKFDVDETTLKASRRCPKEECEYVKAKLLIEIEANNERHGQIIWVEENLEVILEDNTITKLVHQNASKYSFRAVNWSYSKGDTMDSVCVILTNKFDTLDKKTFTCNSIPKSTVNKLYVAMTRTRGNLYLVRNNTLQAVKEKYYKSQS